ncbi:m145 protein [Murid betaherpesvirus 1]|nr:m145 protein [Murid betaherpesvirus 1]
MDRRVVFYLVCTLAVSFASYDQRTPGDVDPECARGFEEMHHDRVNLTLVLSMLSFDVYPHFLATIALDDTTSFLTVKWNNTPGWTYTDEGTITEGYGWANDTDIPIEHEFFKKQREYLKTIRALLMELRSRCGVRYECTFNATFWYGCVVTIVLNETVLLKYNPAFVNGSEHVLIYNETAAEKLKADNKGRDTDLLKNKVTTLYPRWLKVYKAAANLGGPNSLQTRFRTSNNTTTCEVWTYAPLYFSIEIEVAGLPSVKGEVSKSWFTIYMRVQNQTSDSDLPKTICKIRSSVRGACKDVRHPRYVPPPTTTSPTTTALSTTTVFTDTTPFHTTPETPFSSMNTTLLTVSTLGPTRPTIIPTVSSTALDMISSVRSTATKTATVEVSTNIEVSETTSSSDDISLMIDVLTGIVTGEQGKYYSGYSVDTPTLVAMFVAVTALCICAMVFCYYCYYASRTKLRSGELDIEKARARNRLSTVVSWYKTIEA